MFRGLLNEWTIKKEAQNFSVYLKREKGYFWIHLFSVLVIYLLVYNIFWVLPVQHKRMACTHPFHSLNKLRSGSIECGFPGGTSGKEPAFQCRRCKRHGFNPWAGKIPWRRKWQPTPVFLLGKSHEQRSLAGYSPWDSKESDTTERLTRLSNLVPTWPAC